MPFAAEAPDPTALVMPALVTREGGDLEAGARLTRRLLEFIPGHPGAKALLEEATADAGG